MKIVYNRIDFNSFLMSILKNNSLIKFIKILKNKVLSIVFIILFRSEGI